MPSPEEQTQPKRDSGQASNADNQQPLPGPPSQSQSQPQPSGHPPVMGYPGYPSPYPAYPNAPYNHQYANAQAPLATYYGSPYPTQQHLGYRTSAPSGFFRGILTGLIVLAVILCLSTVIMWLVLRPQVPVFTLTRFAVSGFNVTGPAFSSQWTANLTVENPNTKLQVYFDRIQSFVYYRNTNGEDEFLATTFFPPVYVDTKKTAEIGQSLTAGEKEQPMVPSWVVDELRKERATGTVSFSFRMFVWGNFKADGLSTREKELKVFCEKLKVGFNGDSGNGTISLPKPLRCLVYL